MVRDADRELLPALRAHGQGLLPFFPLAGGLLTGKYKRGAPMPEGARLTYVKPSADRFLTERSWSILERLDAFCAARGHSLIELAFSWLASRSPVSSVIAGATKPEQLDANVRAIAWHLTPEDLAEIDKITN
jgi:aryl-alcohol dehydrogenase-like predicted oxidoreductase